jgi:16S rRNA processing protein RimM
MRLVVARIGRAHGIRGEVSVELRTDVPQRRFVVGAEVYPVPGSDTTGGTVPTRLTLVSVRHHGKRWLLRFEGVPDRNAAEALRGLLLEAEIGEQSESGQEEEDAWYDHQLIGCVVQDVTGRRLGSVVRVDHLPAQDMLVIRTDAPGPQRLVPFVAALVPEVDVPGRRIVVDDPGGLLEDLPDPGDIAGTGPGTAAVSGDGTP